MFLLGFFGGKTKDTSVVLHQFPDQQESVDGCDAVGNKAGEVFPLGASFAFDKGLVPQSTELRVVLLYLSGKFFLAESDLFKRVIMALWLFYGKHGVIDNG